MTAIVALLLAWNPNIGSGPAVVVGPDGGPVSVSGALTATVALDAGSTLTVFPGATFPVSIASMPSTPVTGTFWQSTQPVSGRLTCDTFNATDGGVQAVSGTFWQSTQPVSGTVTSNVGLGIDGGRTLDVSGSHVVVDSAPVTHAIIDSSATLTCTVAGTTINAFGAGIAPVTDTQLRATPVPVSGRVTCDTFDAYDGGVKHVVVDSAPTTAVTGTFWPATQPVSGRVTADVYAHNDGGVQAVSGTLTCT